MTRLAIALVALAAAIPSTAIAADPLQVPPTVDAAAFDWAGAYVGVNVAGSTLSDGGPQELTGYVNLVLGANAVLGEKFVVGIEGTAGGFAIDTGVTGFTAGVEGRAGVLVDPSILLYGTVGALVYNTGAQYGTVGFGAEFALTENMSVDFDYQYFGLSNNGFTGHGIGVSANWHL